MDLLFIFSLKTITQSGNSQGLIRLSHNAVSRAMYKERKQITSTSLDSIRYLTSRFFREIFFALDENRNIFPVVSDGLAVFNSNPQQIERIKKGFCHIFRENDLKITVKANTTKVNFLDVTLDLQSGKHYPYTKEGNIPLYVHKKSNHPPSILKNIPESINKRLSEISSDKESFDKAKETYQDALNKGGYIYNLT